MVSLDINDISGSTPYWVNGRLQAIAVNPAYGRGCLSAVTSFSSGVSMLIQDFSLYGNGDIQVWPEAEAEVPLIAFSCILSGVRQVSCQALGVLPGDGVSCIQVPGYKPALATRVCANTPVRVFAVCLSPVVFEDLTKKKSAELVEMLDILDRSSQRKSVAKQPGQIDIAQKICGHQAFDSFVACPDDTLFLEAKALELVALQLRQLEYLTGKTSLRKPVNYHRGKIRYACEILKKEMANPPDKLSLARRVGLNHNQLVQGFKEMVGLCPFAYLRILRLEKARDLIARHECNVTEAAFAVGYSSPSHFSKNFRKEFGITPKALQNSLSKQYVIIGKDVR